MKHFGDVANAVASVFICIGALGSSIAGVVHVVRKRKASK